jgi:SAM-dependent methyltransferase
MRHVERLLRATALAERHHFWFRGFRRFVAPLLHQATEGVSAVRLLDCGCGTGANLELLGRFGRAYGFDVSEAGLRIGRESGRTRLVRATVAAAPFPSGAFDVVTSFDVLYTRSGGFTIVNVAAMESLRGDHSVLSREVRRYDRRSLERLLTDAGFEIVRLTYTNASLFLPMLALRALQRRRGLPREEHAQQEITVPPAPVNALLTAVLVVESWWLRRMDSPFGSSLLCLARKPERAGSRRS